MDEQIKMRHAHTVEYYLARRKKEILRFATMWMAFKEAHYDKWDKPYRVRQILHGITQMWNHKKKKKERKDKKAKFLQLKVVARGWVGGTNRKRLIKGCKISTIRWIWSENLI